MPCANGFENANVEVRSPSSDVISGVSMREAIRRSDVHDVDEIETVAAAHHRLVVQLIREADARLDIVLVVLIRILRVAIHLDEGWSAAHRPAIRSNAVLMRELTGLVLVVSKQIVETIVFLEHGSVEVPAQAEVQSELVGQAPVVLDPRCVVGPAKRRVEVVVNRPARRGAQQERCDGSSHSARLPS